MAPGTSKEKPNPIDNRAVRNHFNERQMTYEYACTDCGHAWEAEQSISAAPLTECPNCKHATAKRQVSGGAGFILKGGGWYADLYSSSGGGAKKSEGTSDTSSSSTDSKPKTEAAPTTTTTTTTTAPATPSGSSSTGAASS